jgi:hypothetical protein
LEWVEIRSYRSYEAAPEPHSSSIRSLSSGCEGATAVPTSTPSRSPNSPRRAYRGSYIGLPTSKTRKLFAIPAPASSDSRRNVPITDDRVNDLTLVSLASRPVARGCGSCQTGQIDVANGKGDTEWRRSGC